MVLFSATTGVPQSVLLDNGYLTNLRTAAAGAVAARHLSRPDSRHIGILGAGVQARLQLEAIRLVRDVDSVKVWSRDPTRCEAFSQNMQAALGIEIQPVRQPEDARRASDIIVTAAPATKPLIQLTRMLHEFAEFSVNLAKQFGRSSAGP